VTLTIWEHPLCKYCYVMSVVLHYQHDRRMVHPFLYVQENFLFFQTSRPAMGPPTTPSLLFRGYWGSFETRNHASFLLLSALIHTCVTIPTTQLSCVPPSTCQSLHCHWPTHLQRCKWHVTEWGQHTLRSCYSPKDKVSIIPRKKTRLSPSTSTPN
jgi:hypothetical protein